jgi:hypothetical protein
MKTLEDGCILVDDSEELEEFEYAEVSTSPWRHGNTSTYVVTIDGKPYLFTVNVHHDEGWEPGTVKLHPAVKVMRPTWVRRDKATPEDLANASA